MKIIPAWIALWLLLFMVSTRNHPSLAIDAVATSIMVLASYGTLQCWQLRRRHAVHATRLTGVGEALCFIAVGGACAAAIVTWAYDALLGPDPRRFSLLVNIELDTLIVGFNFAVGLLAGWAATRSSRLIPPDQGTKDRGR